MYRHFAVVTLALTTGLAMFAEGERREPPPVQPTPTATATPATFASAAKTSGRVPHGWDSGAGFDGPFGRPMEGAFADLDSGLIPDLADLVVPGYSPEYLASLSEAERELLLQGLRENGMLSPETRRQRSAALGAASDRRSGARLSEG